MFPLSLAPPKNAEKAFKKDFFSSYPTTRTYAHFYKKVDSSVAGFPRKRKKRKKKNEGIFFGGRNVCTVHA